MTASKYKAFFSRSCAHDRGSSGEIVALTGIRGLAAIGVMAFHYWGVGWIPVTSVGGHACARGYISVDLFFLLSGLVMAKAYGAGFKQKWTWKAYVGFMYLRLARIYPVYLAVVFIMVAVMELRPHHASSVSFLGLMANLLLVQSWFGEKSYVLVAWSLSTEWAAYVVFPLLVRVLLYGRPAAAWLACSGAAIIIVGLGFYGVALGKPADFALDAAFPLPGELLRCFAGFTLGMGVYRLASLPQMRAADADWIAAATIAVLTILWMIRGVLDLLVYACFPAFLLCLTLNTKLIRAVFGNKAIFLAGEWSYSIYLTHMFYFVYGRPQVFNFLLRYMPSPVADAIDASIFLALTIAVSATCFRLIEVPARSKLRALINVCTSSSRLEPSAP